MTSPLDNLCGPGKPLSTEPPDQQEIQGLIDSGLARLADAEHTTLSLEGRFDLAYNAAHALCLAALRWHGYRPGNRYDVWRVLAKCHDIRNRSEYEGSGSMDERIVTDLVSACRRVAEAIDGLTTGH